MKRTALFGLTALLAVSCIKPEEEGCTLLDGTASVIESKACSRMSLLDKLYFSPTNHYAYVLGSDGWEDGFPTHYRLSSDDPGVTVVNNETQGPHITVDSEVGDNFTYTIVGLNDCGSEGPELTRTIDVYKGPVMTFVEGPPNRSWWKQNTTNATNAGTIGKACILPYQNQVYILGGINRAVGGDNEGVNRDIHVYNTETLTWEDANVDLPDGMDGTQLTSTVMSNDSTVGYVYDMFWEGGFETGELWKVDIPTMTFTKVEFSKGNYNNMYPQGAWREVPFVHNSGDKVYYGPFTSQYPYLVIYDASTGLFSQTSTFTNPLHGATNGNYPVANASWEFEGDFYYGMDYQYIVKYSPSSDQWTMQQMPSYANFACGVNVDGQVYLFYENDVAYQYTYGQSALGIGIEGSLCKGQYQKILTQPANAYYYKGAVHIFNGFDEHPQIGVWMVNGQG